jgi:hypothetical protein
MDLWKSDIRSRFSAANVRYRTGTAAYHGSQCAIKKQPHRSSSLQSPVLVFQMVFGITQEARCLSRTATAQDPQRIAAVTVKPFRLPVSWLSELHSKIHR